MIKRFLVAYCTLETFLQRGKACAVPFRSTCRCSGIERRNRRDPARQSDQFESIEGTVQVEEANAVKRVDVYLRDQQFEFAASQYLFLYLYICFVVF